MAPDQMHPTIAAALRDAGIAALNWYHVPAHRVETVKTCVGKDCGESIPVYGPALCEPCGLRDAMTPDELLEARGTR